MPSAQVETRLRFEDFSFVRAVAEMNDGKLYMSQRWVKAAGGCSAPNAGNVVPEALLGKMKLRFDDDSVTYGKPNLVQLMIRHPNESALAADFDGEKVPQFVRSGSLIVSAGGDVTLRGGVEIGSCTVGGTATMGGGVFRVQGNMTVLSGGTVTHVVTSDPQQALDLRVGEQREEPLDLIDP